MSYHMDVLRVDLHLQKTDPNTLEQKVAELREQEKLWLGWIVGRGHIEPEIACFDWDRSFIRDLLYLRDLGVRGHMILLGSEDELVKYELGDDAVRVYEARHVLTKRPRRVYRRPGDVG